MNIQKSNLFLTSILFLYFLLLLSVANSLSISPNEANIYYNQHHHILWYLTHFSTAIFGENNIALRLPSIIFYILSIVLMYILTYNYFTKPQDRLISILIFMFLPGMNSAALLVDGSIIVVFGTLLYLYIYKLYQKECYLLLFIFLFVDNSFAILFLGLFFYSLRKKDNILLIVSLLLFGVSMQMYGFDMGGKPKGYFVDTFGIYASIFSPILFLYFFYVIYRISIKGKKDIFWYISFTSLGLSLLFSLRQQVYIGDFAPFVVIAVPMMVRVFLHSFRIRLKQFRNKHLLFAKIMLSVLLLNLIVVLFNKPLYLIIQNPKRHFAYKLHGIDYVAQQLKSKGINKVVSSNLILQKQLYFYGIKRGSHYYITRKKPLKYFKKISIKYYKKPIKKFYIVKI